MAAFEPIHPPEIVNPQSSLWAARGGAAPAPYLTALTDDGGPASRIATVSP
jgi:hypothetical protein